MLLKIVTLTLFEAFVFLGVRSEKFNCSNPTNYWQFRSCCNSPSYFPERVLDNCRSIHVTKKASSKNEMSGFLCMSECVFNETDFFTNGKISIDKINKTLINYFRTPIWENVLNTVLPICMKEVVEKETELRNNKENIFTTAGGPCDFMPLLTFACINLQIFRNCPVPFWVISDRCAKVKTYDDKCSLIPGIPRRL